MFPDSRRSQAQRDGQCSHLARGHSPSSGSKGENWVVSNIHIRRFGGLQWLYIYVYIHSYIFVGGFKHLFFLVWVRETLDVWNQSKFHPSKSCTMWWFHICFDVLPWKLGKMKPFWWAKVSTGSHLDSQTCDMERFGATKHADSLLQSRLPDCFWWRKDVAIMKKTI